MLQTALISLREEMACFLVLLMVQPEAGGSGDGQTLE